MRKRLLAFILVLAMMGSVLPMAASAADVNEDETVQSEVKEAIGGEAGGAGDLAARDSNSEDGNAEGGNVEDDNTEGGNTEDGNAESGSTEGGNAKGGNAEDSNAESGNTENGNAEGVNAENSNTENANVQTLFSEYSLTGSSAGNACPHENTDWYYTEVGRAQVCLDCKQYTVPWEEHTFAQGVCTKCGYKLECVDGNGDCICDSCGDEWHDRLRKYDAENHWTICAQCGITVEEKVPHMDINNDELCDECGFPGYTQCTHQNTRWSKNQFIHYQVCKNCQKRLTAETSHTMIGGVCTVCGYSPCDEDGHSFTWGSLSNTLGAFHICDVCGYYDVCEDNDDNCICDICGSVIHDFALIGIDEENHQKACTKCGTGLTFAEPHIDSDDNGICDQCYYQIRECTHENADYLVDYAVHVRFCPDCRTVLSEERTEHNMQNGSCTVCGYVTCEEHSYEYIAFYGKHVCVKCFTEINCEDANHDCVCDICGQESHPNSTYEITKHYHYRICSDCGQINGLFSLHDDHDEDGKCDECGYQMVQGDVIDPVPEEPDPEEKPAPEEQPAPTESTEPEEEILPDTSEDPELVGKPSNTNGAPQPTEAAKTVLQAYQALYKKNSDMFGWVTIAGTKIDYPVMHTPGNPEKYLDLDFEQKNSDAGTPFINAECDFDSDNVIIYAKNMEDGSMFHGLLAYQDEAFWRENPVISFHTIYEEHAYEVLAAFYTEEYAEGSTDFQIDDFVNADNAEEFDEAISYIRENAIYNTGVEVNYGDKLVTLIAIAENERFVVVAKKK